MSIRILRTAALTVVLGLIGPTMAADLDVIDLRIDKTVVGNVDAGREKAQVCNNCHGADGKAPIPNFPSVAGLPEAYLFWKLVAFKESQRTDSVMTPLVANNTLDDLRDIAVFYASLPLVSPSPLSATPVEQAVLDRGRALYLSGDPAKGIPACQGCHGVEGKGPSHARSFQANWPPLYGQQAIYVAERLSNFHKGHAIDSSMDKIMQGVARNLGADDIDALAAYIERLDGR